VFVLGQMFVAELFLRSTRLTFEVVGGTRE
jgi:hypothetical protein